MDVLAELYGASLALLTDLYELTMACAAWRSGASERELVFHLFYRTNPFGGGYAVACGLEPALSFLSRLRFDEGDLAYLRQQRGADGAPLFEEAFLEVLSRLELRLDVDGVREGTVVFPQEPLLRVQGPVIPAMLVESALLNLLNFETLIATKAARVCTAAAGDPVLEFGLRRAQGIDGALSASRASFVGGCDSTSNTLAGKLYGIPVRGTHAHSWVMMHDSELESFEAYARAMPNNCVLLVDTYDTLEGVRHAVEVGHRLREQGHELLGIRLDSGDLAYLSIEARKILDEGGFPKARIYASSELDEHIIQSLKLQGAKIAVWGVGTRLVTGFDEPALGGVYKLSASRRPGEAWKYRVKVSEQAVKTTTPGILQVRRFRDDHGFTEDMIYDVERGPGEAHIVDPLDPTRQRRISPGERYEDLLVPVMRQGRRVLPQEPLTQARERARAQLAGFHGGVKRFVNPHRFPVGLERGLHELKTRLVLEARHIA